MRNQNNLTDVAKIVDWVYESGDNLIIANVRFTDDTEATLSLNDENWAIVKRAELDNDIKEAESKLTVNRTEEEVDEKDDNPDRVFDLCDKIQEANPGMHEDDVINLATDIVEKIEDNAKELTTSFIQCQCGGEVEYADDNDDWHDVVCPDCGCPGRFNREEIEDDEKTRVVDIIQEYCKNSSEKFGLCAWCKSYYNRKTGTTYSTPLTHDQFMATRTDDRTSHGMCPACAVKMSPKNISKKSLPIGTEIKITQVDSTHIGGFGDSRNIDRTGVIIRVILDDTDEHPNDDILYEIAFNDDVKYEEQHWMDVEAGMQDGNSTHYHSEITELSKPHVADDQLS